MLCVREPRFKTFTAHKYTYIHNLFIDFLFAKKKLKLKFLGSTKKINKFEDPRGQRNWIRFPKWARPLKAATG